MTAAPWGEDLRTHLEGLLDEYRGKLRAQLDGLSEEEARRSLVPSATTLLGVLKHVTFVERYWFDHAVTGTPLQDLGVATTPHGSWRLRQDDTVASVLAAHREACDSSRRVTADLDLDDVVDGARGPRPLGGIYLHVLREMMQHCGHADILREQVLAAR